MTTAAGLQVSPTVHRRFAGVTRQTKDEYVLLVDASKLGAGILVFLDGRPCATYGVR
jgi:hypothetical protein